MGFGQIDMSSIPQLDDHTQALRHYDKVVPIRGSSNIRPIGCRRKQHMRIHVLHDGSVACRLYSTDVVTYHPDDSITIRSWSSNSTNDFAYAILPSGIRPAFTKEISSVNYYTAEGEWLYVNASRPLTFERVNGGRWRVVGEEPEPYYHYKIDRKKMNAAVKASGLDQFETWLRAYVAVSGNTALPYASLGDHHALDYLGQGVDGYRTLAGAYGLTLVVQQMRHFVTREYGCVTVTTKPRLEEHEFESVMSSIKRLAHLVSL